MRVVAARLTFAAAVAAATASSAAAQTATVTIELPVVLVARLAVNNTVIALGSPQQSDYGPNGKTLATPVGVTVKTNAKYTLSMAAARTTFLYTKPDAGFNPVTPPSKAVTDLRFATTSGSACGGLASWTPVTQGGSTVLGDGTSGSKQGSSGDQTNICFNTLWSYDKDSPGNYSVNLVFTLSAP